MLYPLGCLVTPYSASPLRMNEIRWPDELLKVTGRPFATTTPESLLAVPAASPLPRRADGLDIVAEFRLRKHDPVPHGRVLP